MKSKILTLFLALIVASGYAQDTLKHSPTKAALLGAVFPGAGQIYNKKYWKLPFVYGGLFVFGYSASRFNDNFVKYSQAIIAQDDNDRFTVVSDPTLLGNIDGLKRVRDQARRNRDYFIILGLMFYGLTIVDAVVDAHFKDFDVSPKLSMKLKPSFEPLPNSMPSFGLGLSLKFQK